MKWILLFLILVPITLATNDLSTMTDSIEILDSFEAEFNEFKDITIEGQSKILREDNRITIQGSNEGSLVTFKKPGCKDQQCTVSLNLKEGESVTLQGSSFQVASAEDLIFPIGNSLNSFKGVKDFSFDGSTLTIGSCSQSCQIPLSKVPLYMESDGKAEIYSTKDHIKIETSAGTINIEKNRLDTSKLPKHEFTSLKDLLEERKQYHEDKYKEQFIFRNEVQPYIEEQKNKPIRKEQGFFQKAFTFVAKKTIPGASIAISLSQCDNPSPLDVGLGIAGQIPAAAETARNVGYCRSIAQDPTNILPIAAAEFSTSGNGVKRRLKNEGIKRIQQKLRAEQAEYQKNLIDKAYD